MEEWKRGRGSSRSSDIRELIRPRGETSLWFLTDQPKVPRGASTADSGDGYEEGITDGQKPCSRAQLESGAPLLAVRKETRSEVDCAGVDIAKNHPTRLVPRLVLPFHSLSWIFIRAFLSCF